MPATTDVKEIKTAVGEALDRNELFDYERPIAIYTVIHELEVAGFSIVRTVNYQG